MFFIFDQRKAAEVGVAPHPLRITKVAKTLEPLQAAPFLGEDFALQEFSRHALCVVCSIRFQRKFLKKNCHWLFPTIDLKSLNNLIKPIKFQGGRPDSEFVF